MHEPTKPTIQPSEPARATGKRTLVVTTDAVWPPVSGGDLRNWQNANALASFGEVVVASVREPIEDAELSHPHISVTTLASATEHSSSPRLAKRKTPLDSRIPIVALERLLVLIADFKPDAVVVEGIPLYALLAHIRPLVQTLVLDMHNIESYLAQQMLPSMAWLAKRFSRKNRSVRRLRDMELQSLRMVDKVWVCSEQDRMRLLQLSGGSTSADVVPNGIPRFDLIPDQLVEQPPMADGQPVILFVGHLNYAPNIEAAERLAKEILPKIHEALPGARLVIAGRSPNRKLYDLAALPGVELVRDPEDLSLLYRQAHMAIVPLVSGGGTRLKILEAMAWGLPVVATQLAAEGLGLVDGADVDFADSNDDIVARAVALWRDPALLQRRRRAARTAVAQRFGPDAIEAAIKESLGRL